MSLITQRGLREHSESTCGWRWNKHCGREPRMMPGTELGISQQLVQAVICNTKWLRCQLSGSTFLLWSNVHLRTDASWWWHHDRCGSLPGGPGCVCSITIKHVNIYLHWILGWGISPEFKVEFVLTWRYSSSALTCWTRYAVSSGELHVRKLGYVFPSAESIQRVIVWIPVLCPPRGALSFRKQRQTAAATRPPRPHGGSGGSGGGGG